MLTIDEIKDVKFRTNRQGTFYKAEDVDSFIDEVIETIEHKNNEKAELVHKMDILATRIEQYRSDEETVRNALLSAQKVADSTLKEANEQSELSIKNAKEKSEKLVADAQTQVAKEKEAYIELQKKVADMRIELFKNVKKCVDLVDALPSDKTVEEIKAKLDKEFPTPKAEVPVVSAPKAVEETVEVEEDPKAVEEEKPATKKVDEPSLEGTTKFGVLKFGNNYDVDE